MSHSTLWIATGRKIDKIPMDDLEATVPYVLKSCNLRRTKNFASYGLIREGLT